MLTFCCFYCCCRCCCSCLWLGPLRNRTWVPVLSLSLSTLHSPERAVPACPGLARRLLRRLRTESGVVLLNVHQNHFCVSTKPQMYTSNVVGPINYICGQLDLVEVWFEKSESNLDLLQKLKVFNCQTDKWFFGQISFPFFRCVCWNGRETLETWEARELLALAACQISPQLHGEWSDNESCWAKLTIRIRWFRL